MKFSAITLLLAGALGFVLGKLNSDRQPLIALAQTRRQRALPMTAG